MILTAEISQMNTIFVDTAPIIYFIEAHPVFGPLARQVVDTFQSGKLVAYSSVITLTEVLPKPVKAGDEKLAKKFAEFLKYGKNFGLVEITVRIAEKAGILRGRYPDLKTIDAIQLAAAIDTGADVFITNDKKLKQVKEIKVIILESYLEKR